jgi:hypothetical protein
MVSEPSWWCCDAAVGGVQRGRVPALRGAGSEGIDGGKALVVAPPVAVWLGFRGASGRGFEAESGVA